MQFTAVTATPFGAGCPAPPRLRRAQPFVPASGAARRAHRAPRTACQASPEAPKQQEQPAAAAPSPPPQQQQEQEQQPSAVGGSVREALRAAEESGSQKRRRAADSTDWMATQMTRRFGLAGGLAWVGFLAFGVIGEQVKTRIEVASEAANTRDVENADEVVTPEGLRYRDLKIGGGSPPIPGYIVIVDYKAYANGVLFEDTIARKKPIVFLYGKRPLSGGMCPGTEKALAGMKAGGIRRVVVPPELGFGESGLTLRPTEHVPEKRGEVPPGATLEYELSLLRVSIPPS